MAQQRLRPVKQAASQTDSQLLQAAGFETVREPQRCLPAAIHESIQRARAYSRAAQNVCRWRAASRLRHGSPDQPAARHQRQTPLGNPLGRREAPLRCSTAAGLGVGPAPIDPKAPQPMKTSHAQPHKRSSVALILRVGKPNNNNKLTCWRKQQRGDATRPSLSRRRRCCCCCSCHEARHSARRAAADAIQQVGRRGALFRDAKCHTFDALSARQTLISPAGGAEQPLQSCTCSKIRKLYRSALESFALLAAKLGRLLSHTTSFDFALCSARQKWLRNNSRMHLKYGK